MLKNDLGDTLPNLKDAPLKSTSLIRWIWFFAKDKKVLFILTSLTRLVAAGIEVAHIYIAGQIVNSFVDPYTLYGYPAAYVWLAFFVLMYIVYVSLIYMIRYVGLMRSYTEKRFSITALRHYFTLPMTFHENMETGGQLQKLQQARTAIQSLFFTYYYNVLTFIGNITGTIVLVFSVDISSLYVFAFGGYIFFYSSFVLLAINYLNPHIKYATKRKEKVMAGVYEFLNHIRLVKSHRLSELFSKKGVGLEFDHHNAMVSLSTKRAWFWIGNCTIAVFFSCLIMYMAITDALSEVILVGTFVIISQLVWSLWNYLEQIVWIFSESAEQKISVMRVVDIFKEAEENIDLKPSKTLPNWQNILIDNVSYTYEGEKSVPALEGISMTIRRGEHVGLVGYSGSGKSTFVKLMMKMMLPTSGNISLDKSDLSYISRDEYLAKVSFVPQDVDLFNDTAKENIVVGQNLSRERFSEVLKLSYVDQFIHQLPDAEKTKVGERGVKLSGGQRQRIGIARAIARDGDIVIFDEATSALDSVSEHYIQESLKSSFKGKTLVVVAHRLATIAHLDRIYVFDKGSVVEEGTHEELLSMGGRYAEMWHLQSDGFLKEE